jgi:hypothetical protein
LLCPGVSNRVIVSAYIVISFVFLAVLVSRVYRRRKVRLTLLTIIPPKLCATKITGRLVVCQKLLLAVQA